MAYITADYAIAAAERFAAQYLLADRGYDTKENTALAQSSGIETIIPPKKNRRAQRDYDRHLHRRCHLVENAALHWKRWRGITARYAKNTASYVAVVQIRCIVIWSNIAMVLCHAPLQTMFNVLRACLLFRTNGV